MRISRTLLMAAASIIASTSPALAASRSQTGSTAATDGSLLNWTATSYIIAATPTGTGVPTGSPTTNPGGGDQTYRAPNSAGYSGVVGMLMTYADGSRFVCSGTLVGMRSIVTAGHCVSSGGGVKDANLVRTQVFFQNDASSAADERVYGIPTGNFPAGVTAIDVSNYTVNANYTGEVIDQNDIAVLTLADLAPSYAQIYGLYTVGDLTGDQFNVTGYGLRSAVGGAAGTNTPGVSAPTGFRRQGDNLYDYRFGADEFDGFFTDRDANGENFFGTAEVAYSYVSDFDNGLAANDTACRIAAAVGAPGYGCNTGIAREVNIAGGDSGGGAFINGMLASVNSYGLSFGTAYGDFNPGLNASFGEFSGYVPIFIHTNFIQNAIAQAGAAGVPEPATWAQMLLGFGMLGFAARRSRRVAVAA